MKFINELKETTTKLATSGKGILAADESTPTITKRFQAVGIEPSEEMRRAYRDLLMSTPHINKYIAGIILYEETLNQKNHENELFSEVLKKNEILPGIKVDKGLAYLPNTKEENITQGLDNLAERLIDYKTKGARFAKWRAVYSISKDTPSDLLIRTNAEILARYAAICQDQGIVPIVEPEVLIDGDHSLQQCEKVTEPVLQAVFEALHHHRVLLEYIVLKPSMVINGKNCTQKASVIEVAEATLRVLRRTVPSAVPTINFLSGGQSPEQATAHLNAMNQLNPLPWNVSFSYARALQDYCMKTWQGQTKHLKTAQQAFYKRVYLNGLAATGQYNDSMENEESILLAL